MCGGCAERYQQARVARGLLAEMLLDQRPELFADLTSLRLAGALAEHLVAHACAGGAGFGVGSIDTPVTGEVAARLDFLAERDEGVRVGRHAAAASARRRCRRSGDVRR